MSDAEKAGVEATVEDAKPKLTVETLQAQLEEIRAAQSGSDKKVGELQTQNSELLEALAATKAELDDQKQKGMTAEQKLQHEMEQLEKAKAEVQREKLDIAKQRMVSEMGIPTEFAPFIHGKSVDEIRQQAQKIKEVYEGKLQETVETKVNERLVKPGEPESSGTPKPFAKWDGTREGAAKLTPEEAQAEMLKQIQE